MDEVQRATAGVSLISTASGSTDYRIRITGAVLSNLRVVRSQAERIRGPIERVRIIRRLDWAITQVEHVRALQRNAGPDGESVERVDLGHIRRLLQLANTIIRSERIQTRRETEGVLQTVIAESIETHENRPRPACPTAVEKMLQKIEIGNVPEEQCSICLDDYEVEMGICVSIPCSHHFHKDCIMKWLEESNTCPMCRFMFPAAKRN
ncbi:hypothetical protein L6164_016502 [Bauhinia variegata]|uniref:Uncharacterized protein n=1 Tax=Bauhinia variegata TaxID=167791 RepID=A0ACB9NNL9_BAUVA|nr:hypothetical protein L6164_016502 [Bauhinia variegata]